MKGFESIVRRLQALAEALEPVAEAFVRTVDRLDKEFSRYDYASDVLSKAGWVPHYTTPFEQIATWDDKPAVIRCKLLNYYTGRWSQIRSQIESQLRSYDINQESKATLEEALEAHESGLYRCVTRVLFPEIERLFRLEMDINDRIRSEEMICRLANSRKSALTKEASLEDFAPSGLYELALFDRITQVLSTESQVTESKFFLGLYESVTPGESLEKAQRDPVPNRHAALHGLVVYSSLQNSLNMIFVTDYVFQVVDRMKRSPASGDAG